MPFAVVSHDDILLTTQASLYSQADETSMNSIEAIVLGILQGLTEFLL